MVVGGSPDTSFSWLTGNADMHLKNFSLFRPADNYMLTPAYDLLSTALPKWYELINASFLPRDLQEAYHHKIDAMAKIISI